MSCSSMRKLVSFSIAAILSLASCYKFSELFTTKTKSKHPKQYGPTGS